MGRPHLGGQGRSQLHTGIPVSPSHLLGPRVCWPAPALGSDWHHQLPFRSESSPGASPVPVPGVSRTPRSSPATTAVPLALRTARPKQAEALGAPAARSWSPPLSGKRLLSGFLALRQNTHSPSGLCAHGGVLGQGDSCALQPGRGAALRSPSLPRHPAAGAWAEWGCPSQSSRLVWPAEATPPAPGPWAARTGNDQSPTVAARTLPGLGSTREHRARSWPTQAQGGLK